MKLPLQYLVLIIVFLGCSEEKPENKKELWKAEIMEVEHAFDAMAQKDGLSKAFGHFAASEGVIKRGKRVISGKDAIAAYYEKDSRPRETLSWTPTFIDVSAAGDLAYTYGDYVFTYRDSLGNKKESKGIFHTVWKRQTDGSWKFVYD